jgi:hypothetical protein
LIPYENEIIALRYRKPPIPYSRIAELLREKYQIVINRERWLNLSGRFWIS